MSHDSNRAFNKLGLAVTRTKRKAGAMGKGKTLVTAGNVRHLRSSIVWTAAAGFQEMPISHDIAQAKISNLDVHLAVQQQVLWLEIPVHHHIAMAVFHTRCNLLKESASFLF